MKALEQVIADWRSDAQAARRLGHTHDAELVESVLASVGASDAEAWLTWLSHPDAKLRSGENEFWFRRNRPRWVELGLARKDETGRWVYRLCIIPQRVNVDAVVEDAKRAAEDAA